MLKEKKKKAIRLINKVKLLKHIDATQLVCWLKSTIWNSIQMPP